EIEPRSRRILCYLPSLLQSCLTIAIPAKLEQTLSMSGSRKRQRNLRNYARFWSATVLCRFKSFIFIIISLVPFFVAALLSPASTFAQPNQPSLESGFLHPPDSARPGVYWFWVDGNVTGEGITADLEAMKRVGLGAALLFNVTQNLPRGAI